MLLSFLARSVPAVGKDCLSSDPSTLGSQELDDGRDVLDIRKSISHGHALMERDGIVAFLGVEEGCGGRGKRASSARDRGW